MPITYLRLFILFSLLFITRAFADNAIAYHWVEFGPKDEIIARLITLQSVCPLLDTAQGKLPMRIHHSANKAFPVTICQIILPKNVSAAQTANVKFALPKISINKIVIIGDTGCRLKKGVSPQACDNPKQWPFAMIAQHAAVWKPDLVIHVGDYLYRESRCPAGDKTCANSPHGDNWATWEADFYKPAKPLLQAAPWIFVRGNHEMCERSGEGWTHLLDPFGFRHCLNHSPLYSVNIGDQQLFIMDSANASDFVAPAQEVDIYENYLKEIAKAHATHVWLITHKPFWFVYNEDEFNQALQASFLNTLETAWEDSAPANIGLLISGHIHRFQTLNFSSSRSPQLIVGASGTRIDDSLKRARLKGFSIAGETVTEGLSLNQFGYMTLERTVSGWVGQIRDPYGKTLANCALKNQRLLCQETWRGKINEKRAALF